MSRRRFLSTLPALLCAGLAPARAAEATSRAPVLLVAAEELEDDNFGATVVLVVFPKGGAPIGVILNKPSDLAIKDAFPDDAQLRSRAEKVFFGGPVRLDLLTYLVRTPKPPREGYAVLGDLYLSQDAAFLDELLARQGKIERYFLGTAVWLPEQLEAEIEAKQWFVLPAERDAILDAHPQALWRKLLSRAMAVET